MLTRIASCGLAALLLFACASCFPGAPPQARPEIPAEAQGTLYPVKVNGKWGYINRAGKVVVEPQFDAALDFQEGLGAFNVGGGRVTQNTRGFSETSFEGGKWGFVDASGKTVIEPQFDGAWYFSEGLALVQSNGPESLLGHRRYGYIDRTGRLVIPAKFTLAYNFSEGLAAIRINEPKADEGWREAWGFIDKSGKLVIEAKYTQARSFSEGLAAVYTRQEQIEYLDHIGKTVCVACGPDGKPLKAKRLDSPSSFFEDEAYEFHEGLARFAVGNRMAEPDPRHKSTSKYYRYTCACGPSGFLDRSGRVAIAPRFGTAQDFHEGLASVHSEGQPGYIDKTGKVVIPAQLGIAWDFSEGLAPVPLKERERNPSGEETGWHETLYGYINHSGEVVIEPQFSRATGFKDGVAKVEIYGEPENLGAGHADLMKAMIKAITENARVGYIDRMGKYIWEPSK